MSELKKNFKSNLIIASPDKGGVPKATFYADLLDAHGIAIVYKERDMNKVNQSKALDLIGDVSGKDVLIVDDMIDTAGTLVEAANLIMDRGAKSVSAAATHGLFSDPSPQRIFSSKLDKIFVTDTVPIRSEFLNNPRVTVISVASLLAEAIRCINDGSSMSEKLIPKAYREQPNPD
jgi:ribose-phosphate pyrophosphokinase